jgi:hypothetical protein
MNSCGLRAKLPLTVTHLDRHDPRVSGKQVAAESASSGRKRREREAWSAVSNDLMVKVGKRNWKRADLYARS